MRHTPNATMIEKRRKMAELFAPEGNFLGLSRGELEQLALTCGEPRYRGGQGEMTG